MRISALAISTAFVAAVMTSSAQAQPRRVNLPGHIHPRARAENDQGRVSPVLPLSYVTITLGQSAGQKAALEQLLKEQQTPASPNYHRWITPEEYGQRFGASQEDLDKVTSWLQGQGLTIAAIGRAHNWIAVNGQAAQMEGAFQTELHRFAANGESHFANIVDPSVPAELSGIVRTVRGLHDFIPKPSKHALRPAYTSGTGKHYLAPNDVATIYDVNPLYNSGIDGSGQKLVVAGQTQVNLSDIQQFRSSYNLPAKDPQVLLVPGSRDPGFSSPDVAEADLDLEWSGAMARNATVIYVYAFDVLNAVQYAVDQNLAPVISSSYGSCELETPSSDIFAFQSFAQQANAQGITWISSVGDSGAADCNDPQNAGLAADVPGSIPEVTGLGGTEFQEGGDVYWNASNDGNRASALSYIPEMVWNDSATDGQPSAGGGGVSVFFPKPSWQTGPGVPGDNARHVPDIALSASADHDGYLVYSGGSLQVFGGTSVPAPTFAGIATLLNQYLVASGAQSAPGLGNMNPGLYSLARTASNAFHDITSGNNIVTVSCTSGRFRTCNTGAVGYSAGPGYDNASGLGSIDAYNLVTKWGGNASAVPPGATLTLLSNLTTFGGSDIVTLTATATGPEGATPVGTVEFESNGAVLGSASLAGSGGTSRATVAINATQLPLGSQTITAVYSLGSSAGTSASITVTVLSSSVSNGTPSISGLTNGASYKQSYAPGMILTIFGSQLSSGVGIASVVPLPISMNGVAVTVNGMIAPLYYVSSNQLNVQIPYEAATGSATVSVNNSGRVTTQSFTISSAAPGIFTDPNGVIVPNGSESRGGITTLYITGAGTISPAVPTGGAPVPGTSIANLPLPNLTTTMTVGNLPANIEFIGDTIGLVGVIQINFQVPAGLGLGAEPVVVSVGGIPSNAAQIVVTN
jgi:uncharacterized protein (TIGR03437 family)